MTSKRAIRRKQCTGKIAYKTVESAARAARTLSLSFYRCPFCTHLHVGHTPHKIRQAIAQKRKDI